MRRGAKTIIPVFAVYLPQKAGRIKRNRPRLSSGRKNIPWRKKGEQV
jgi:hypothetical protein